MLLYFPVTSLVTLFGNILQDPLDPRARSDARLMKIVVTFVSMLGQEAETGGVHRMLSVCSEFERVAHAVIDKAENNLGGRRKRKVPDPKVEAEPEMQLPPTSPPTTRRDSWGPLQSTSSKPPPPTNQPNKNGDLRYSMSPPSGHGGGGSTYSPMSHQMHSTPPTGWTAPEYIFPSNGEFEAFGDGGNFMDPMQSPPGMTPGQPFQEPLLPQDLFSLPMTLDWSWAEMSGQAYPTVENGNFGGGDYQGLDQPMDQHPMI